MFRIKRMIYLWTGIMCSGLSNLIIKFFSFKKIVKALERKGRYKTADEYVIRRMIFFGELVEHVADIVPWRSKCYENALSFIILCRLFNYKVYVDFGVYRSDTEGVVAHAWTYLYEDVFTGDEDLERYTVVLTKAV